MNKVSISHMGHAYADWLRALDFYKNELILLTKRLTEVAGKNTSKEVGGQVEHYENQFKLHTEAIDKLLHDIHLNISSLSKELQSSGQQYVDKVLLNTYSDLKDQFIIEEKLVNELRHGFNEFAAEWM